VAQFQYLLNIVRVAEHYLVRSNSPTSCGKKHSDAVYDDLKTSRTSTCLFQSLLEVVYIPRHSSLSPTSHLSSLKPTTAFRHGHESLFSNSLLQMASGATYVALPSHLSKIPFTTLIRTESKYLKLLAMPSLPDYAHGRFYYNF
jgi:hypothetical protein